MREPLEGVNLFYLLYWLFINELSILEYLFHIMGTGECKLTRLVDGNYIFFFLIRVLTRALLSNMNMDVISFCLHSTEVKQVSLVFKAECCIQGKVPG